MTVAPCPECRSGKCRNCDGYSWDTVADERAQCPCDLLDHVGLMRLDAFVEGGYLQEVNRLLLHPLGLALAVMYREDGGGEPFLQVHDLSVSAPGVIFDPEMDLIPKARKVVDRLNERFEARLDTHGWIIQPAHPGQPGGWSCPGCGSRYDMADQLEDAEDRLSVHEATGDTVSLDELERTLNEPRGGDDER